MASQSAGYLVGLCALALAAACSDETTNTTGSGGSTSSSGQGGGTTTGTGGGGVGGGGGAGGAAAGWDAYCDTRGMSCVGFPVDKCKTQEACAKALLRDEVEQEILDCLATECIEDDCIALSMDNPPSAQGQSYLAACNAEVAMCPNLANDLCGAAYFLADDVLADFETCALAPNCVDAETCFDDAVQVLNDCEDWL